MGYSIKLYYVINGMYKFDYSSYLPDDVIRFFTIIQIIVLLRSYTRLLENLCKVTI